MQTCKIKASITKVNFKEKVQGQLGKYEHFCLCLKYILHACEQNGGGFSCLFWRLNL